MEITHQTNKLKSLQNLLVLSAATLMITVWSTVTFLAYQNSLLMKSSETQSSDQIMDEQLTITPVPSTKTTLTPNLSTSGWKTYSHTDHKYSFKYPFDYSVISENEKVTIRSTPTQCQTGGSADRPLPATGYDTVITVIYHTGTNYKDIWKKAFDFEFDPSDPDLSSDGTSTISGKPAYYFLQGAEMTYGRTAYLVELTPSSALEINSYVPVLLFNCERPLDQFKGQQIADTILSTFSFSN